MGLMLQLQGAYASAYGAYRSFFQEQLQELQLLQQLLMLPLLLLLGQGLMLLMLPLLGARNNTHTQFNLSLKGVRIRVTPTPKLSSVLVLFSP